LHQPDYVKDQIILILQGNQRVCSQRM